MQHLQETPEVIARMKAEGWAIRRLALHLFAHGFWIESPKGEPCWVIQSDASKAVVPLSKDGPYQFLSSQ